MPDDKHDRRSAATYAAAVALAMALTTFGCTTNRTPGNGDPIGSGPAVGGTSAPNTGSSGGTTPVPPPEMDRLVTTAEQAAKIMAPHQAPRVAPRGKVLGPVNPAPTPGRGAEAPPTGQLVNPSGNSR